MISGGLSGVRSVSNLAIRRDPHRIPWDSSPVGEWDLLPIAWAQASSATSEFNLKCWWWIACVAYGHRVWTWPATNAQVGFLIGQATLCYVYEFPMVRAAILRLEESWITVRWYLFRSLMIGDSRDEDESGSRTNRYKFFVVLLGD